jgi:DNA-directed RNA polymerase specialized sigma24 family protein
MAPSIDDVLNELEINPIVRGKLSHLTPVQARVIGLAFFDGLSHREVAQSTHMPLGTVKSHLSRALLVLRKALTGLNGIDTLMSDRQVSKINATPMEEDAINTIEGIPSS